MNTIEMASKLRLLAAKCNDLDAEVAELFDSPEGRKLLRIAGTHWTLPTQGQRFEALAEKLHSRHNCSHLYSRSLDQLWPRRCQNCGALEESAAL